MAAVFDSAAEKSEFGTTLRYLMKRPTYELTPGWLSKLSGIPKASIVNWLEGKASRPRNHATLPALCDALRLSVLEKYELYGAAGALLPSSHLDELGDNVPLGLYRTTPQGSILYVNMTLVKMLGYAQRSEYQRLDVGRDLYARPEQRTSWEADIRRVGTLLRQPVWAKRADGSPVLLLDSATAVRDQRGTILYYEGVWEFAAPDVSGQISGPGAA